MKGSVRKTRAEYERLHQSIERKLKTVQTRLRYQQALNGLSWALLASILVAIVCLVSRQLGASVLPAWPWIICGVLCLIAVFIGLIAARPMKDVAKVIDQRCQLKDRTAVAFDLATSAPSPVVQLQQKDAIRHLDAVNPQVVVPIELPSRFLGRLLAAVLLLLALAIPKTSSTSQAATIDRSTMVDVVTAIDNEIEDIENLAEETNSEELATIAQELQKRLDEIDVEQMTEREVLKTMSDLQNTMEQLLAESDVKLMDTQLDEVADALAPAEEFRSAADAIKKKQFEKAAELLDQIDAADLPKSEARPVSEKLADAAKSADQKNLKDLSETLEELAESVKQADSRKSQKGAQKLAQALRKQAATRKLGQALQAKSEKLGEMKNMFSRSQDGNGQAAAGLNLAKGKSKKRSQNSSQKAGAKSAGNIDGKKTRLNAQKQIAKLTGQIGQEGDSDVEKVEGEFAEESARRKIQQTFQRYEKMSEVVLESEAIPLGHRQIIRDYFEAIRPPVEATPPK